MSSIEAEESTLKPRKLKPIRLLPYSIRGLWRASARLVSYDATWKRVRAGWSIERALTEPNAAESRKGWKVCRHALALKAKSVPCTDCSLEFPEFNYTVMEFDHVPERGPKEFNISEGVAWNRRSLSIETLKAEIAKCDVVCANCHKLRTAKRRVKCG